MSSCHKISELISGYLDDELVQGDRQRIDVHLQSCAKCRQTLDDMTKLRGAVAVSSSRENLSSEQWEKIMNDLPAKASRGIGWLLFISGLVALIGFCIWEFAIDNEIPLHIKLATSALWGGLLFLFLSVLRQRMVAYKSDRYKDVQI